jgi:hypothetical protein
MTLKLLLLSLLCVAAACTVSAADCDPLDEQACFLPYPNNYFTRPDLTSSTRLRLNMSESMMPATHGGKRFDPSHWNQLDGFPLISPALSYWGADMNLAPVAPHWNISWSLFADSPTVLLDVASGRLLPHWSELDETALGSGGKVRDPMFMTWPAQSLGNSRHVVVAYRSLKNRATGALYEPSAAFKALRDNTPSDDPSVEARRAHFETLFAALEKAGVQRSTLQLAWDYTTASEQAVNGWMLEMRDDAEKRIADDGGLKYFVTKVEENPNDDISRLVHGKMTVPLYLNNVLPGSNLVIVDNKPQYQRMANFSFLVQVPKSLTTSGAELGSLLHVGHGLFGSMQEITAGWYRKLSNDYNLVLYATDWQGMSNIDVPSTGLFIIEANWQKFRMVPDRLQQSMINHLVLTQIMVGPMQQDPSLQFDSKPIVDPSKVYYTGSSNGGILASPYLSLERTIIRGCMDVPGGPYALLLPRSVDFDPFKALIEVHYNSSADFAFMISFIQSLWDRGAPGGYMHRVTQNTFPDTPPKRILVKDGLHDSQVSYLGGATLARSLGASIFPTQLRDDINGKPAEIYGFPTVQSPDANSISLYQTYFWETPPQPETDTPPNHECDTHGCTRKSVPGQQTLMHFFYTGEFVDNCGKNACALRSQGPCNMAECPLTQYQFPDLN